MFSQMLIAGGAAPNSPTSFNASDTGTTGVTVTWTNSTVGTQPIQYDLYESSALVASDITSGYFHSVGVGLRTYFVRAHNSIGSADSNSNNGLVGRAPEFPAGGHNHVVTNLGGARGRHTWDETINGYPEPDYSICREISPGTNSCYSLTTESNDSPRDLDWPVGTWQWFINVYNDFGQVGTGLSAAVTIT